MPFLVQESSEQVSFWNLSSSWVFWELVWKLHHDFCVCNKVLWWHPLYSSPAFHVFSSHIKAKSTQEFLLLLSEAFLCLSRLSNTHTGWEVLQSWPNISGSERNKREALSQKVEGHVGVFRINRCGGFAVLSTIFCQFHWIRYADFIDPIKL